MIMKHTQAEGLIAYDEVRATVQRYIDACKSFDDMQESIDRINGMLAPIARNLTLNMNFGYTFWSNKERRLPAYSSI